MRDTRTQADADVVLGEDWVSPEDEDAAEISSQRRRRQLISINHSPLARKIITFNLLALIVLVAGVLYLNPFRDTLVAQRELGIVSEAELIADLFEAVIPVTSGDLPAGLGIEGQSIIDNLDLNDGVEVFLFDQSATLLATTVGSDRRARNGEDGEAGSQRRTTITGMLKSAWSGAIDALSSGPPLPEDADPTATVRAIFSGAAEGFTQIRTSTDEAGRIIFSVTTPIVREENVLGVVALTSAAGEIDELVRSEREQVLQMFFTAILVSVGLSLVLASTIANPLADLATAAEIGRDKHARKLSPSRVRIPDLTARPDEIGRLSGAMRGMVAALYDRIEANEQFAADVAHEIKNPLASLRSAVGTLRVARRDDQRDKLFDVIDHDVRRLDRLISDISNASRLDSELVKEEEEAFDLLHMLSNISTHFSQEAGDRGVDFITDLPSKPINVQGLEARLAQVFVNLISNAVSFCEAGDAVRIWARRRDNRVLVVVEDTGPGIPEQAIQKIFNRFYSERPVGQFGNHSGLGLAISKQIVEAHGGVIWAENIRPTDADLMSEPLGARFVVGLPV